MGNIDSKQENFLERPKRYSLRWNLGLRPDDRDDEASDAETVDSD